MRGGRAGSTGAAGFGEAAARARGGGGGLGEAAAHARGGGGAGFGEAAARALGGGGGLGGGGTPARGGGDGLEEEAASRSATTVLPARPPLTQCSDCHLLREYHNISILLPLCI